MFLLLFLLFLMIIIIITTIFIIIIIIFPPSIFSRLFIGTICVMYRCIICEVYKWICMKCRLIAEHSHFDLYICFICLHGMRVCERVLELLLKLHFILCLDFSSFIDGWCSYVHNTKLHTTYMYQKYFERKPNNLYRKTNGIMWRAKT